MYIYAYIHIDTYVCIHTYRYICIHTYIHTYMHSSSCRAASTDIPGPLPPLLPIIHHLRQVFRITSCVLT